MRAITLAACLMMQLAAVSHVQAGIELSPSSFIEAEVNFDGIFTIVEANPAIPSSGNVIAANASASSSIDYVQVQSGGQTTFDLRFTQESAANAGDVTGASAYWKFTAKQNGTYSTSGALFPTSDHSNVFIIASLKDVSANVTLFDFYNLSESSAIQLDLGKLTGTYYDHIGSPSGPIVSGNEYELLFAAINFSDPAINPLTLSGDFHFQIDDATSPVPEPSSLLTFALGGIGALVGAIRPRKIKTAKSHRA